ncbi:hypothetical protein [Actinoplanes sp. DH11]|uniref:hypothetical protein n=1 Tax=Actinoplanes sp. DH11 TaxID=2857011 RepID=UPI001E4C49D4|nr:hypothetical protein [Actinoplanes sp. DH11]
MDTLTAIFGASRGSLADFEVISRVARSAETVVYLGRAAAGGRDGHCGWPGAVVGCSA